MPPKAMTTALTMNAMANMLRSSVPTSWPNSTGPTMPPAAVPTA
jgi:hypothetical protein